MFCVLWCLSIYPQRRTHGWWSSTTTQSWPESDRLQVWTSIQSTLTTRLKRNSYWPPSASQSTANKNCPTSAGSPASSTLQVKLVCFSSLLPSWLRFSLQGCKPKKSDLKLVDVVGWGGATAWGCRLALHFMWKIHPASFTSRRKKL